MVVRASRQFRETIVRAKASKDGLTLRVIAGANNVLLAMDLDEEKRKSCLGFSIERTDLDTGERRWIPNMIRFKSDALDAADIATHVPPVVGKGAAVKKPKKSSKAPPEEDAPMVSTARAPIQKFRWGDYTLDPGKRYRYRVVARYGTAADIIRAGKEADRRRDFDSIAGGVSVEVKTENNHAHDPAVFFNRGAAASRAYNLRYGDNDPTNIPDALWWLSRGLEEALISFIGQASDASFAIHAAIYEFQKPKLLQALKLAAGRNVDVKVAYHARAKRLKNGKVDPKDKTAAKNNAAIRAAGITFAKPRDADPQGAIMHNKFVVLLKKDATGKLVPMAAWTGSTNWTDGAIYGQLNVGHATYDGKVAAAYEAYFQLLYANASADEMKKHTVALSPPPKDRASIAQGLTPIFSPQAKLDMIDLYAALCGDGKMVMVSAPFALHPTIMAVFKKTPKDTLRFLMADKPGSFGKPGTVKLLEHDPSNQVAVAATLSTELHDFQGRLLEHEESFHHSGVHIHSKIIAIDPFGADPVLVTGSANFSNNSTRVNDENSLIIRGDTAIMDVYVTEFMRMFEHYWFRAHLEGKTKGSKKKATKGASKAKAKQERLAGLAEDASWSDAYYTAGTKQMLERVAFQGIA